MIKESLKNSVYKIKKNLYVYAGEEHDQVAQKPELINLDDIK